MSASFIRKNFADNPQIFKKLFIFKVFNNLILGSQDSVVAGYPRIQNTDRNLYTRYELDYIL